MMVCAYMYRCLARATGSFETIRECRSRDNAFFPLVHIKGYIVKHCKFPFSDVNEVQMAPLAGPAVHA